MTVSFTKMTGAGNDFILINNLDGRLHLDGGQVRRLCDRHFGIGADGLMLLEPSGGAEADFQWQFFNADGSEADMCGNGARCFARYVRQVTGWPHGEVRFRTRAGVIRAAFLEDQVAVDLTPPSRFGPGRRIDTTSGPVEVHFLNTGVPHAVVRVPDADQAMVASLGREIRHHAAFQPGGANVNFVQLLGPGRIRVRTYERGVENETLACGTGVTASALVLAALEGLPSPIEVQVRGGDILQVHFAREADTFRDVRLVGPATFVFEGRIDLTEPAREQT